MKRRSFLKKSMILGAMPMVEGIAMSAQILPVPAADKAGWTPLFNGHNLDGWYTFLQASGKNKDPRGSVRVEDGMIHILGNDITTDEAESGYVATNREFSDCRIRLEYKWGTKRFPPRSEQKRDSGLLHHLVGPDHVWPSCVEFQIQESDTGDIIMLGGVRGTPGESRAGLVAWPDQNTDLAAIPPPPGRGRGNRVVKASDFENLTGWNVAELVMQGDKTAHIVNGRLVNSLFDIQQPDLQNPGQFIRLDRGKIALEVEWAEVWFRNIAFRAVA